MPFWQGKKVLVTGHTGFKGSWLCLWLMSLGAEVIGFAKAPPNAANLFELAQVSTGMISIIGNIGDYAPLKKVLEQHKPEIVIHMAAQALVRYSYQNPLETYATNVMGTVHLLEAIRSTDCVKVVLNVTTDKCYANSDFAGDYREEAPLGGFDPYSSSKACSELVTASYRQAFFNSVDFAKHGVAIATARAGNVIGGGDWAQDRLIPDIMMNCLAASPVLIRHPQAIRPWQHVLDALSGYLTLAQALYEHPIAFAEAWNFGPDKTELKPVQWLVDYLLAQWGGGLQARLDSQKQPHEAHAIRLNCAKAKTRLHWQSQWPLPMALDSIVAWYRAYQSGLDMRAFTLSQINSYEKCSS